MIIEVCIQTVMRILYCYFGRLEFLHSEIQLPIMGSLCNDLSSISAFRFLDKVAKYLVRV